MRQTISHFSNEGMQRGSHIWQSGMDSLSGFNRWCSGPPGPNQAQSTTAFKPEGNCWYVTATVLQYFICERSYCSTDAFEPESSNVIAQIISQGTSSRYLIPLHSSIPSCCHEVENSVMSSLGLYWRISFGSPEK